MYYHEQVGLLVAVVTLLSCFRNALNIVKDDLIAKVDELSSEQEILREEIRSLHELKTKLQSRVHELEAEVRKLKEETEKHAKANMGEEEVSNTIKNCAQVNGG